MLHGMRDRPLRLEKAMKIERHLYDENTTGYAGRAYRTTAEDGQIWDVEVDGQPDIGCNWWNSPWTHHVVRPFLRP